MISYNPQKIERKWQKYWETNKTYRADDKSKKPKYYQLETFPYPSADGLHVGHPKGYVAEDIHARFMRMKGSEVMYTIGWDAFGLPTENYAIKVNKSPQEVAKSNIKNFKRQVKMFGLSYDWEREINTSEPEYYKWTQWLFIQLYKTGLAYQQFAKVNWCPKDQTVLANEQVINGRCYRCDSEVIQKEIKQWFFKITEYTEQLLKDLEGLDWPEATIKRQKDWIGKSEGAKITFKLTDISNQEDSKYSVEVFTTRPDTIFGATFIVVSPELAKKWMDMGWQASEKVKKYISSSLKKRELDRLEGEGNKTGVETDIKAINPATKEKIPVWIADYVLGGYGTGAIMAVPAHDERDFEFAKKFNLPINQVIMPSLIDTSNPPKEGKKTVFRNMILVVLYDRRKDKYLTLRWRKLNWVGFITGGVDEGEDRIKAAQREILEETGYKNTRFVRSLGTTEAHFFAAHKDENRKSHAEHLFFELVDDTQDRVKQEETEQYDLEWLSLKELHSVHLQHAERDMILKRLEMKDGSFTSDGILMNSGKFDGMYSEEAGKKIVEELQKKGLAEFKKTYRLRDWSVSRQRYWGVPIPIIYCDQCGVVPVPDKDLPVKLPKLKDYRPKGVSPLASSESFLKVKCPNCQNHAKRDSETLDTFVDSSWYYFRYADPHNKKKFADSEKLKKWMPVKLYVIGAEHTVLHLLYSRFITKFLHDQKYLNFVEPFLKIRHVGLIQGTDGQKMSKSKGNVINPDPVIAEYGADAVRLYEMFMGPFEDGQPWDTKGVIGVYRFLNRVWNYVNRYHTGIKPNPETAKILNKYIKEVGEDIREMSFNTGVSGLMKLLNEIESYEVSKKEYEIFLKLLAPFAPHLAEELWQNVLKNRKSVHLEKWPEYDDKLLAEEMIKLVVQVNGRFRNAIEVKKGLSQEEAKKLALSDVKTQKHIVGEIKKVIYLPDKIINIVV